MTLDELRALCTRTNPLDGKQVAHIYLTLPAKTIPRGATTGLIGRRGPRGRICTVNACPEGGFRVVAVFSCAAVLAYMDAAA